MSKGLLMIIGGLVIIAVGVALLLAREKIDQTNKEIKEKANEIKKIDKTLDYINIQLIKIEKPLILINTYSNKVLAFFKKL